MSLRIASPGRPLIPGILLMLLLFPCAPAARAQEEEPFEIGDGIEPTIPGVADILGDPDLPAPDWQDLFNADGSLKDLLDENGQARANGVPDFIDLHGGRAALFLADEISSGLATDLSVRFGVDRVETGPVSTLNDLGNAYAYTVPDAAGNLVLYLGVERLTASGESYVEFEINQGTFRLGHGWPGVSGWEVKGNRSERDLRVRLDYGRGKLQAVTVDAWQSQGATHRWVTRVQLDRPGRDACNAADSSLEPALDGAVLCAVSNAQRIPSGEWTSYDAEGVPSSELERHTFTELGLNVGRLLGADAGYVEPVYDTIQLGTPEDLGFGYFSGRDAPLAAADTIGGCMNDQSGRDDVCTASDVRIAQLHVVEVLDECDFVGDEARVLFQAELIATSNERWDVGMWVALDGGDARNGTCHQDFLAPPLAAEGSCDPSGLPCQKDADCPAGETCSGGYDPAGGTGPFYNGEVAEDPDDLCGDLEQDVATLRDLPAITIGCFDNDGDGSVDVGTCLGWDNHRSDGSAQKPSCLGAEDTLPNTKSKCRCEDLNVALQIKGTIVVVKETDPSDHPGVFDFSLDSLPAGTTHQEFTLGDGQSHSAGPLEPGTYSVVETVPEFWELASAECDDGSYPASIDLAPSETVTCTFRNHLLVDPPVLSVVKENDADLDGTFHSTETSPDFPVTVSYRVSITNDGDWDATITAVSDDTHDIAGSSCEALLGATIAAGETLICGFEVEYLDDDQTVTNIFAASARNIAGEDSASDDSTVIIADLLPQENVIIEKTASPVSVPETGGLVTFTVTVTNIAAEPLTLESLDDDVFGNLDGKGSCSVPQPLGPAGDPGDEYSCSFTELVSGDVPQPHVDVATAGGSDDDGNTFSRSDDAVVDFVDVLPEVSVVKDAAPGSVPETGGEVTFTVTVGNLGLEAATLDSLVDDVFGDLHGRGSCSVPQPLAAVGEAGDSYTCTFSETLTGEAGGSHVDIVTATASDDEGNADSDSDDAVVGFDDVLPEISVVKDAAPGSLPETGGEATFTVTVSNLGLEAVTLDSLVDDVFGDLDGRGDCSVPRALSAAGEAGDGYTCAFTETLSGNAGESHVDVVTATASDNDGNSDSDSDDASVTFEDVLPDIDVVKDATPSSIPETGAEVTFTFTVTNGSAEGATITSLIDDVFGDLDGRGSCVVPQDLAAAGQPGASYVCSFTELLVGQPGLHVNVVTATGADDEGNTDSASDEATVVITDVPSSIVVTKSPSRQTVPHSGGYVQFRVTVDNTSPADAVTIDEIVDDVFGVIASSLGPADIEPALTTCDELVGTTLPRGASAVCGFSVFLIVDEAQGTHENTVTVDGTDDDGVPVEDSDHAIVGAGEGPGVGTPGYWANHPEAWVLVLDPDGSGELGTLLGDWNGTGSCEAWEAALHDGCIFYAHEEALEHLLAPTKGDKTRIMGRHAIASWQNIVSGNDFLCIEDTMNQAIAWLNEHPIGSLVEGGDPAWETAGPLADELDSYNNGFECGLSRDTMFRVEAYRLSWSRSVGNGGAVYDVTRGDLATLAASAGDFTASTRECLGNDYPNTNLAFTNTPPPGEGYWFAVRPVNDTGPGTYDSEQSRTQSGSRDEGIDSSPASCP